MIGNQSEYRFTKHEQILEWGSAVGSHSCLHKTRISDELPNGSQQELEHFHIDLETAFLQRQSYCVNRDVVCQLPPEAGHPPFIAASLKRAYGMNDAPRRSWNFLDKLFVVMV